MIVRCTFCNGELNRQGITTYRRVTGWERKAISGSRRGGSDIVLREPVEEFACHACIDAQKNGRSPSQGALL